MNRREQSYTDMDVYEQVNETYEQSFEETYPREQQPASVISSVVLQ